MLGETFSRGGSCCRPWHARRLDRYAEAVFRHCRENEPDLRRIEQGAAWSCCYRRYRSMTEKPLRAAYDGVGSGVFSYDASRMFAYAVDLPIAGQAVRASVREPFLALVLRLDPYRIAELALKVFPHGVGQLAANHPVRSATRCGGGGGGGRGGSGSGSASATASRPSATPVPPPPAVEAWSGTPARGAPDRPVARRDPRGDPSRPSAHDGLREREQMSHRIGPVGEQVSQVGLVVGLRCGVFHLL